MRLELTFVGLGNAVLLRASDHEVLMDTGFSISPGAYIEGQVGTSGATVRLKVRRCRRSQSDRFEVTARWVNLTRQLRDSLLGTGPAGAIGVEPEG